MQELENRLKYYIDYYDDLKASNLTRFILLIIYKISIIIRKYMVKFLNLLPSWLNPKKFAKTINYNLGILLNFLNRGRLIPPPKLARCVGGGSFKEIGKEHFRYFKKLCDLKPNEKVLDVGCGAGQKAIPLMNYLVSGSYEGFDIVPEHIKWCKENITKKFPNFHFQLADIYNSHYNPNGKLNPANYRFPFANESFDFVFLTSVFTHMLPDDVNNYLSEISRVLKRNGRCFISYFLLNEESLKSINEKSSYFNFKYKYDGYRTVNDEIKGSAIGLDDQLIRKLYKKNRLKIIVPIYYGSWCKREEYLSFQDFILARKD